MNREPIKNNGVTFGLKSPETLYFTAAMSGVPFIEALTVTSESALADVDIKVRVISASGSVSSELVKPVATVNQKLTVLEDLKIAFDSNAMYQIADPQNGSIVVELHQGEVLVASASWEIRILPANFWIATGENYQREIQFLAAFSQPNHPSIREILDKAVARMSADGKPGQLSGYQDGSLVESMVKSIYEAIQSLGLTYSNPPASWSGGGGQKIRTTQEILSERVGTCLDTTMLMSSCLEQAGLAPLVILIPGHAFVGYWTGEYIDKFEGRIPRKPPVQLIDDIKNHLDLGHIRFVETTTLASSTTFEDSQAQGKPTLDLEGAFGKARFFSHAIDIVASRRGEVRIDPLPARFTDDQGNVQIVEYVPPVVDMEMLRKKFAERDAVSGLKVSLAVPPRVRVWLDSLLDLSLRNPLISFAGKKNATRLMIPPESLGILEDLLQSEKQFQLLPAPPKKGKDGNWYGYETDNSLGEVVADPDLINLLNAGIANPQGAIHTDIFDPDRFIEKLRKTASDAKSVQQETGSNALFLALGSLSWKVKQGEIESPLILVPVTLTPKNRGKAFMLSIEESGVTPNFSLVEKLKIEHQINLPGLAELSTDKHGIDIDGTLRYVREELAKAGVNDFKVNSTATLGFFNFSSYRLWKDLLDNWKRFENNPLVKHLIYTPGEAFVDTKSDDDTTDLDNLISELPISADGSQARAVAKAINGNTFVLQGPPGTGKSQTITNLLAKALNEGKRVLFVAEKRDALDVVKERIDAAGLGAFSLDLHDKNSTTKAVKQQLADVIDIHIEPDKLGFEQALQDYDSALKPLQLYRNQLHEVGSLGESVFSAMDSYLAVKTAYSVDISGEFVSTCNQESLAKLVDAAKSISSLGTSSGNASTNPWSLLGDKKKFEPAELDALRILVIELSQSLDLAKLQPSVLAFIENAKDLEQLSLLKELKSEPISHDTAEYLGSVQGTEQLGIASGLLNKLLASLSTVSFDTSRLEKVDLAGAERDLQLALASNFLVKGMKVKKVKKLLEIQLGTPKAIEVQGLTQTIENLELIKSLGAQVKSEIEKIPGFTEASQTNVYDPAAVKSLVSRFENLANLSKILHTDGLDRITLNSLVSSLESNQKDNLSKLVDLVNQFMEFLDANTSSLLLWAGKLGFGSRLISSTQSWLDDAQKFSFSQIIRWSTLLGDSRAFVELGLTDCRAQLLDGSIPFDQAANAFNKGFYNALFQNLLVVQGLGAFDGGVVNNYVRKLEDAHDRLRSRLPRVLGSALLEKRGFDSSMKVGAIGDLVLSVKQKVSKLPLRSLLEKHWGVISTITPCVLASPDSAVRFLSAASDPFDLVVFDEASQIRVANSIGALGRAKAAVIVGDSQQMPPTSVGIAKTSASSEEEEPEDEEEFIGDAESILEQCTNARVPEIMLSWHYRSEDESLIAFSNHNYYKGGLSTFPTPNLDNSNRRLFLVNVGGQFIRTPADYPADGKGSAKQIRTNPVEAAAIVRDIEERLSDPARKDESIGIVTLNAQQKAYVEDLLSNSKSDAVQNALEKGVGGEDILVKALENVQGSERDVVLLSTAFSPRKSSPDVLPLQFGPIINQGGHRRLNVAITRARKEVKVFTSFEPKMLEARKPASRGLQDLAKFMISAKSSETDVLEAMAVKEERIDRHREAVAGALREAGLTVLEEVGLSDFKVDIAVMDPARPKRAVLGILLDGNRWNKRETVSDRDSLPVSMLTGRMGWAMVERIWLPTWLRDQAGEVRRITEAFEAAKSVKPKDLTKRPSTTPTEPIYVQKADLGGKAADLVNPIDTLLEQVPHWHQLQPKVLARQEHLDYVHDSQVKELIVNLAAELTRVEGPVSKQRLAKFIGSCFDFKKVSGPRVEAIAGISFPRQGKDIEGFLYPVDEPWEIYASWQKSDPGTGRPASDISLREIGNAMLALIHAARAISPEQLIKESSRVFGIQKVSKDIQERFEMAVGLAMKQERITFDGDYIEAAGE